MSKSRFPLRIDDGLLDQLRDLAEADGLSLNAWLTLRLRDIVARRLR